MLDQIFQAFRRGDTRGEKGFGRGLAIASQAAKLLGAELSLRSQLGHSSTFPLALPRNDRPRLQIDQAAKRILFEQNDSDPLTETVALTG